MIKIGSVVRVARMPDNNDYWTVPERLLNATGIVSRITEDGGDGGRIYVVINGNRWFFPRNQEGVIELVNKWNTLGYISPFKPLNLP